MIALVGTFLDPKGTYIGWDRYLQLYFWNDVHNVWLAIKGPSEQRERDS